MISKRAAFEFLLEHAHVVAIALKTAGATLPKDFKENRVLFLDFGLNMPRPIADLKVDDSGVSGTLSFNNAPHFVSIPWSCVYMMGVRDESEFYWLGDMPNDNAQMTTPAPQPEETTKPEGKPRGLKLV